MKSKLNNGYCGVIGNCNIINNKIKCNKLIKCNQKKKGSTKAMMRDWRVNCKKATPITKWLTPFLLCHKLNLCSAKT